MILRGSEQAPRGTFKPHDMMLHRLRPPAALLLSLPLPLESFLPDSQKFRRKAADESRKPDGGETGIFFLLSRLTVTVSLCKTGTPWAVGIFIWGP